jgi:peptidoglycan/LPS O-acetylase OafA/YrhL
MASVRSVNVPYLAPIDHLRAVAALMVFGFHAVHFAQSAPPFRLDAWQTFTNPLMLIIYEGYAGVSLFFVISGFLFTYAAHGKVTFSKAGFWWNRLVRIYPMFFFMVFVAVSLGLATDIKAVAMTLLLIGNLPGGAIETAYTLPLWTIAVECQFYAIFPFLLWRYREHGWRALIAFVAFVLAVRLFASSSGHPPDTYSTLLGRLDQFLIGMLAASFCRRQVVRPLYAAAGLLVGAVVLVALLRFYNESGLMVGKMAASRTRLFLPALEAAAWATIVVSYLRLGAMLPNVISGAWAWVGARSYSMYLLNIAVVNLCLYRGWWILTDDWLTTSLTLAAIGSAILIGASAVTYALIERPFMQLRRTYIVPEPTAAEAERRLRVVRPGAVR